MDTYVTPLTPTVQSSSFGNLEPPVSPVTDNFTIPISDYRWNQITELQLPDGKKVLSLLF